MIHDARNANQEHFLLARATGGVERVAKLGQGGMVAGHKRLVLVPDQVWDALEPLLPEEPTKSNAERLSVPKAFDPSALRQAFQERRITPRLARRGIESSELLGQHRWVVERTLAWLLGCRCLSASYEWRADRLSGFLHVACALICAPFLKPATASGTCHRAAACATDGIRLTHGGRRTGRNASISIHPKLTRRRS